MKRVLIAGLGKGMIDRDSNERDYRKANYRIQNEDSETYTIYENEYFVTSALEKHYNIDKTIYIGTTGSMWDKLYIHYCEKNEIAVDEEYRKEIRSITENANKNTDINLLDTEKFKSKFPNVEIIITKYGMDETEIFENFTEIMEIINSLDKDDEIYLDITHSFRSNAMWMFLVMNYITDVIDKNIKIKTITYGMLEELDTDINTEGNSIKVASVINLKPFYDLMRWIKGANAFKEYGNSYEFLDMLNNEELKESMEEFSNSMNLNYIANIKENIKKIESMKDILNTLDGPSKLLLPEILEKFINEFPKNKEDHFILLNLAEKHLAQKRYTMVYVNIVEAIYTFASKVLEIEDINKNKENLRKWITEITDKNQELYKNLNKKEIEARIELGKIFEEMRTVRNTISHTLEKETKIKQMIYELEDKIEKLRLLFNIKYQITEEKEIKKISLAKQKNYDLEKRKTYEILRDECKNEEFAKVLKILNEGIYDKLFETFNMEPNGINKPVVKEWLDNKNVELEIELQHDKNRLSKLLTWFAQAKNKKLYYKNQILQKMDELEWIMIDKKFISKLKGLNNSLHSSNSIIKESKRIPNKIPTIIIITNEKLQDEEKNKIIDKYKIKKIKLLPEGTQKKWNEIDTNTDISHKNLNDMKTMIEKNIGEGDYILIQGEPGATFKIVSWAKEEGFIPIYSFINKEKNVEYREY